MQNLSGKVVMGENDFFEPIKNDKERNIQKTIEWIKALNNKINM